MAKNAGSGTVPRPEEREGRPTGEPSEAQEGLEAEEPHLPTDAHLHGLWQVLGLDDEDDEEEAETK